MVGVNLALLAGLHHRYGIPIVATAALTSVLPDWDGLSILFGGEAYARVHRLWGHNLLVASLSGAAVAGLAYALAIRGYFGKMASPFRSAAPPRNEHLRPFHALDLLIWMS